jgi:(2Fe-2S) ferredoxin
LGKKHTYCVKICGGKHCAKQGAKRLVRAIEEAIEAHELGKSIEVRVSKCQDLCDDGPNLVITPGHFPYCRLAPGTVRQIVAEHLRDGRPVKSLLYRKFKKRGYI